MSSHGTLYIFSRDTIPMAILHYTCITCTVVGTMLVLVYAPGPGMCAHRLKATGRWVGGKGRLNGLNKDPALLGN